MSIKIRIRNGLQPDENGNGGAREDDLMGIDQDVLKVAGGVVDNSLEVTPVSGMDLQVGLGVVHIPNSNWSLGAYGETKFWQATVYAVEEITISANSSGSTRYDLITAYCDTTVSPNNLGTNIVSIVVVEGTPGGSVPATPSNSYALASVEVINGATSIASEDITDLRESIHFKDEMVASAGNVPYTGATGNVDLGTHFLLAPNVIYGATLYGGTIATNLDTINKSGFYTCYGTATGVPSADHSWFVTHQNSNEDATSATQRAVAYSTSLIVYERIKQSSTWGNWMLVFPVGREILTSDRTYYVRPDGNDSNDGLSDTSGGAFLTIQKAIDTVEMLDLSLYNVLIQVADGTYTSKNILKSFVGAGTCTIQGNVTTPSNCLISVNSDSCFKQTSINGKYSIKGFKLTTTTNGKCIEAVGTPSYIKLDKIEFGTSFNAHVSVTAGAFIFMDDGTFTISGSTEAHFQTISGGIISANSCSYTISSTPNFTVAFYWADRALGSLSCFNTTFTGSATGKKYQVTGNAVCFTNGADINYLPGNSAGTTSTGGQYL